MINPLDQVTPLIITFNEEYNISRTLAGLAWAKRIVVVDSGSTDQTLEILCKVPSVEVVHRAFDSFAGQCNFGLGLITTPWCLSLDADHVVTSRFIDEMQQLVTQVSDDVSAFLTPFRYLVHGKQLRGALLPPRFNLIRPLHGRYENDGHGHHFIPIKLTLAMRQPILHDDRKPLGRWLQSQERYHWQEVSKLLSVDTRMLAFADKLRKHTPLAPFLMLFVCLVLKGGFLDGRAGLFYALQRCYAELQILIMLQEHRLKYSKSHYSC